jgi:hypothetical protein
MNIEQARAKADAIMLSFTRPTEKSTASTCSQWDTSHQMMRDQIVVALLAASECHCTECWLKKQQAAEAARGEKHGE